jgi:hypothetical protein
MSHHCIIVSYDWLEFEVEFDHYPASRGARERGSGVQLEPDEPATKEITEVFMVHPTDQDINRVDVTEQLSKEMGDYIEEQIEEQANDEADTRH